MGLIVNTPEPMRRVRVVAAKDYSDETLKTLHRAGVLHIEESEELEPVDREAIERERRRVTGLLADIEDVLAFAPKEGRVSVSDDIEVIYTRPLDEIEGETSALCTKLSKMHQQAVKLSQEARELAVLRSYLAAAGQHAGVRLADLSFSGSYLFSRVFVLPRETQEATYASIERHLLDSTVTPIEDETFIYTIARVEDREIVEEAMKDGGGRVLAVPPKDLTPREYLKVADSEASRIEQELAGINAEIENKTRENLEQLVLLREALLAENDRLAALEKACEAKYVTLIEGWVPESNVEAAIAELKEAVGYVFIDTRRPEQAEQPPTKLRNPGGFKPFQVIVNLFGIPRYREWDPTPVIAYSFAFFFGIMLGDVVYAICLILLARFALRRLVDDPETEGFKLFQRLLYISGAVAVVTGILTGTYLGDFFSKFFHVENLALSSTIQGVYLDCMSFIVISLVIGLIHVNLGHMLMLIRGIKERQRHIVMGRLGLFILEIAGVPWVMHFIGADILPLAQETYSLLLYIMGVGIAFIIVGSLMEKGAFLGSIFWIFDITGILGDVMSYARLAGVGLATYYLAYCFNMMSTLIAGMLPAGIIRLVLGTLIAIVILLFGHVLNLVLSSITCFVHSLRLCFVEFLFKFYEGGGREYSPFRLRKREVIPVRGKA
jgi:V/A-type H+-transporting ATPase subunit I